MEIVIGEIKFPRRKLDYSERIVLLSQLSEGSTGIVDAVLGAACLSIGALPFKLRGKGENEFGGDLVAYLDKAVDFLVENFGVCPADLSAAGNQILAEISASLMINKREQAKNADFLEPASEAGSNSG